MKKKENNFNKNKPLKHAKSGRKKRKVLVLCTELKALKNVRLKLPEWNVLFKINGTRSAAEVAHSLGMEVADFLPVLKKLIDQGIVKEMPTAIQTPKVAETSLELDALLDELEKAVIKTESFEENTAAESEIKLPLTFTIDDLFELSEDDQALEETIRLLKKLELDEESSKTAEEHPESEVEHADTQIKAPENVPSEPVTLTENSVEIFQPEADVNQISIESPVAPPTEANSETIPKPRKPREADNGVVLRAEKLVKIYGKRRVVNQVSLQVQQGHIVGLLGPNGAGKTTSFYMITGFITPNAGKIYIDERDITGLAMYKRARLGMAYLPQEASVFRKLTVEENLLAIMEVLKFPRKERKKRCQALMEELRISHIAKNKGYNLSGGERRRTEIARALVSNPKFILLDEPFAGVDPIAVQDIQNIIISLKEKNIGILITDHNVQVTLSITDHAYLLFEGEVLKEGDSEFIANDPEAQKLYLGEKFRLLR